jgi:triacylglycerol lipase
MGDKHHIVFIHGLFGWGPGELGPMLPYWGDAPAPFARAGFPVLEAKCGPISSFHDRACEVFAQIRGGVVDYGEAHSAAAGHVRFSPNLRFDKGFVENWSAANPVILIGHSAGAQTAMQLQALLAQDYWGVGSSADWVKAIVVVAGVVNGSTLTYKFGCDRQSGLLVDNPLRLISGAVELLNRVQPLARMATINIAPWLEHWGGDVNSFTRGPDNLAFDLTLQGCYAANAAFHTNPDSYYLSLVTRIEKRAPTLPWLNLEIPFLPRGWGEANIILRDAAAYQAEEIDFAAPPIPVWNTRDDLTMEVWRDNDGAVSSISQRYPFSHHDEPVGGEGVFDRRALSPGRWYFQSIEQAVVRRFDHFDPVIGARLKPGALAPHRALYEKLCETLLRL